jgi:hypothetical protein
VSQKAPFLKRFYRLEKALNQISIYVRILLCIFKNRRRRQNNESGSGKAD